MHLKADAKDMPAGAFETVRVQIYPTGYAFRAGDKIRVTIQSPGRRSPPMDLRHHRRRIHPRTPSNSASRSWFYWS